MSPNVIEYIKKGSQYLTNNAGCYEKHISWFPFMHMIQLFHLFHFNRKVSGIIMNSVTAITIEPFSFWFEINHQEKIIEEPFIKSFCLFIRMRYLKIIEYLWHLYYFDRLLCFIFFPCYVCMLHDFIQPFYQQAWSHSWKTF